MINKQLLYILLLITTVFSLVSASVFASRVEDKPQSIYDILVTEQKFHDFLMQIEEANLVDDFKNIDKGTVFAPVNAAFEGKTTLIAPRKNLTKEQLLYHIIPVSLKSGDLYDGRLLDTQAQLDGVTQKVKVLKSTISRNIEVGADNGQELGHVLEEMEATNGMIQAVDKVLPLPVYLDETLHINQETENFYELAKTARIDRELKNAKGNTIFVAKDDFFGDTLDPIQKKYLLEQKGGRKDLARFLDHQIAPKIFYSHDLKEGKSSIATVEGSEELDIVVKHNKLLPSTITVNGVKVIHQDVLSANGVIHVLESPILPKNKEFLKLSARKVLVGMNATRFIELFDENDLGSYLDDQNDVITILAPSNHALDEPKFMTAADTKSWLKYHIVHGRYTPSDLQDGQLLETESHGDLGKAFQRIDVHIVSQDQDYENDKLFRESITFGKAGVLGDPVTVGDNLIIYPLARSLVLPRPPLSRLPVNLELSTFVAGLYASGAGEEIENAHGITLFAPTNEAFSRLGLLAKFLLQPESKKKLEQVVTYHAVRGVFYENSTSEGEHREVTLSSGAEIRLNKTDHGFFVRGSGAADGNDRNTIAQVIDADILTSNGVIHTIDRVQLPSSLEITNRDLLSAEGTNSLLNLLERTNLTDKVLDSLDKDTPYTILAPSDQAFGRLNLTHLLENPERLLKVARLHILPVALPRIDIGETADNSYYYNIFGKKKESNNDRKEHKDVPMTGIDVPTLHGDTYVVISKGLTGGYTVTVKGTSQEGADVINLGRSSAGGGVIMIDRVLLPKEELHRNGLPWWAITLIVIGSLIGAVILAAAAYIGWRYYQTRREGHISLSNPN
ncbi:FAS1 domain-containing protein [Mucor mucedo]|uniref:FAS1 domain-containing protein n=1 Tax=Mucor mucedo TaxID=29922 RepID=UPI00221ED89E|nr:FAS1 domain-containing protein [Mucor mucedo]KAI7896307.1 FAS1 domain-containing protein [Mucor mucedo]